MHIVQEGQIVVGVRVFRVHCDHPFQMLNCLWVQFGLEVRQCQIVLELNIVLVNLLCLFERQDCHRVLMLPELRDSKVKECFEGLRVHSLQMEFGFGL